MDPSCQPASKSPTPSPVPPSPNPVAHNSVQTHHSGTNTSGITKRQASLEAERNNTAPVNSLPNELFIAIFLLAEPRPIGHGGEKRVTLPDTASWAPLMLVCRHWRDVILSTPRLWRVIKVREKLKWTELAVSRSQNATLDITFWWNSPVIASHTILLPVAERIASLKFDDMDEGQFVAALNLVYFTHSRLVELYLTRTSRGQSGQPSWEEAFPYGPLHTIFVGRQWFPALAALTIKGVRVVLKDPQTFLSQLRVLDIRKCVVLSDPPIFMLSTFLDILAGCTALEEVRLSGVLSQFHHNQPPCQRGKSAHAVSIPKLRRLIIQDEAENVSSFMSSLIVSPNVHVYLTGSAASLSEYSPEWFMTLIPPNRRQTLPILESARALAITLDGGIFEFTAYAESERDTGRSCGPSLTVSLDFKQDLWPGLPLPRVVDEIIQLFGNAPLTDLHVCHVMDRDIIEEAEWARLFAAFRALEHLSLWGVTIDAPMVFAALAGPQPGEDGGRVVCPGLRTIYAHGPWWSRGAHDCIVSCLATRASGGATTLEKLELEPCFVSCKKFEKAKSSFLREIGAVFAGEVEFGHDYIEELDATPWSPCSESDSDSNSDSNSDSDSDSG